MASSDPAAPHVASLQKELAETKDLVRRLEERICHGESFDTTYGKNLFLYCC